MQAAQNWTDTAQGTFIAFSTIANNSTSPATRMTLDAAGRLGIGTATPAVPLDVVGSGFVSASGTTSYFVAGSTTLTVDNNTGWNTSIRASSGIVAGDGFLTASDRRVKRIQSRSDGAADLDALLRIEVTDFHFTDVVEKGARPQKKVIAQQVETVYPEAVRHTTDVVPDIFQKAPIEHGWVGLATDLKVGDRVRLITENGHRAVYEVLEVQKDKFRTDFAADAGQVFVYGREVTDFRVVDYEAIAMLNVSATQELHRRLEHQAADFAAQTQELATLKQQLAELRAAFTAARLDAAGVAAARVPQER